MTAQGTLRQKTETKANKPKSKGLWGAATGRGRSVSAGPSETQTSWQLSSWNGGCKGRHPGVQKQALGMRDQEEDARISTEVLEDKENFLNKAISLKCGEKKYVSMTERHTFLPLRWQPAAPHKHTGLQTPGTKRGLKSLQAPHDENQR